MVSKSSRENLYSMCLSFGILSFVVVSFSMTHTLNKVLRRFAQESGPFECICFTISRELDGIALQLLFDVFPIR